MRGKIAHIFSYRPSIFLFLFLFFFSSFGLLLLLLYYFRCVRMFVLLNQYSYNKLCALTSSSRKIKSFTHGKYKKFVYCTFNKIVFIFWAWRIIANKPDAKRRMKGNEYKKWNIYIYCIIRCLIGNASIGRRLFSDDFFSFVMLCVCVYCVRCSLRCSTLWTSHSFDFCQLYRCSRVQRGICYRRVCSVCAVHSAVH